MNRSLAGFFSFVIAIVLGVGFVYPKSGAVHALGVEEQAKRAISKNQEAKLAALSQLKKTFSTNSNLVTDLLSVLPQTPQIPETMVSVEAMTKENGIDLRSLTPTIDAPKEQVVLSLTGEGELAAVEGLINDIAANNRPITISSAALVRLSEGNRISVSLSLNFPYRGAKELP